MDPDDDPHPDRRRPEQGLPDHNDPTAGFGGAPPALSALTLRLVLAGIGFVVGVGFAVAFYVARAPAALWIGAAALAVIAAVNIVVVARRKARGEPG